MTARRKGFEGRLIVEKVDGGDGNNWDHYRDVLYHASRETFRIPAGTRTDLGSIPRLVAWYAARSGIAALVFALHDRLWRHYVLIGAITHREADAILRQALRTAGLDPKAKKPRHEGVPIAQRWVIWAGVRWGALTRPGGTKGWWKDAPLVLLWTLYAAVLIAPPAVVVQVFIWLNEGAEWMFYVLAKPFSRKRVNRPGLGRKS